MPRGPGPAVQQPEVHRQPTTWLEVDGNVETLLQENKTP